MRENERVSLGAQITRCYSDNRHAPYGVHLAVASFGGLLKQRYDMVMDRHYEAWKSMRFLGHDFVQVAHEARQWMQEDATGGTLQGPAFGRYAEAAEQTETAKEQGEIVYLTSDSEYTLTELKPYSTYIIGGLVDKNREKGICYKRATEKGIKTARLPIGDYLEMTGRKVLATNHVNEIMLRWLELRDWAEAFLRVIRSAKRLGPKTFRQLAMESRIIRMWLLLWQPTMLSVTRLEVAWHTVDAQLKLDEAIDDHDTL